MTPARVVAASFLILVLAFSVTPRLPARDGEADSPSSLSIRLTPGVEFPIQGDVRPLYRIAYGTDLIARIPLRWGLTPAAGLAYTFLPLRAEATVSALGVGVGGGLTVDMGRLQFTATALGGGYYSFFNSQQLDPDGVPYENQSGAAGYAAAGAELSFFLTPLLSVGLGGLYHNYLGLFHSARAHIATTVHIAGLQQQVWLRGLELEPTFPSLLQYYADHPIGSAQVGNRERFPITDVRVDVFIRDYMRTARTTTVATRMEPGETRPVDLYVLFRDTILDLTEGGRAPAEVTVRYLLNGRERRLTVSEPMRIHHRNSMIWDDDRKAAAFVTARDTEVIRFASEVAAVVRREGPAAINPNLRMAMGMFNALSEMGLSYVVDPNTPAYVDASENIHIVDHLQFPRETFRYRGGDCDDLSILYSALLEAVGVHTAFVTVPGHIYVAVSLGMSSEEARRLFPDERLFIDFDGTAWAPVEITLVGESFHRAWDVGASQWAEYASGEAAAFYPMSANWSVYPAAGWAGEGIVVDLPDRDELRSRYRDELQELVQRQLMPQITQIESSIERSRDPVRLRNRLGVLYAQYGLVEEARAVFEEILRQREYLPALINLGNIFYLEERLEDALELFERAASLDPDNPIAVLNLARITQDLGQHGQVRVHFAKLEEIAPELSAEFSYLSSVDESTSRASDAQLGRTRMLWEADE